MKKKNCIIGLFTAFLCVLTAGIFSVKSVSASADSASSESVATAEETKETVSDATVTWLTDEFVMDYGASVYTGTAVTDDEGNTTYQDYGIRFSVTIDETNETAKAAFENLAASEAKYGVVIVPNSTVSSVMASSGLTDKNELVTAETVFGENPLFTFAKAGETWQNNSVYNIATSLKDISGNGVPDTLYGALVNLYTSNFLQKYVGVAYVGVPVYNEDGSVKEYTYYFAKYASGTDSVTGETKNDVANNTRCMYYVAQKAIENGDSSASILQKSYIDTFAAEYEEVATGTKFKYTVVHHYPTDEGELCESETKGAILGATLSAEEKAPEGDVNEDITYVKDTTTTGMLDRGYLYAGSMTVLHVYYTPKSTQEINKQETNTLLGNMADETATYFDSSMKVTGSEDDPTLNSANTGIGAIFGQSEVTFTGDFVNTLLDYDPQFTTVYIEKAELYIGAGSSIISSMFSDGNIVVDTIEVSGCVEQTLDADVVGYSVVESTKYGQKVATITFTGITIQLPSEKVTVDADSNADDIVLTACVGDKTISGTWTLTGLLFG